MTGGLLDALFFVVALIPAMAFHELAHGWVAVRLGDPTPRLMGRLSLDLRKHVDPFGTFVVPVLLLLPVLFGRPGFAFGYLKPMPIRRDQLTNPDQQTTWVALAGIVTNVVLAAVGAVLFRVLGVPVGGSVQRFLFIWGSCTSSRSRPWTARGYWPGSSPAGPARSTSPGTHTGRYSSSSSCS